MNMKMQPAPIQQEATFDWAMNALLAQEDSVFKDIVAQLKQNAAIFNSVSAEYEVNVENSHRFKNVTQEIVPSMVKKYLAFSVEYRTQTIISDNKNAQQLLLSGLQDINSLIISIINETCNTQKKDFLVDSKIIGQLSSGVDKNQSVMMQATNTKLSADIASKVSGNFTFFEALDESNAKQGRQNLRMVVVFGAVLLLVLILYKIF